ncbi:unnamed protein product [Ceratitis capitata]|uniref:(Mediterranean fruit fly) hypothetical protein n=1 Tax=Ceratitis capitata TaxID=7213 RepID=A0A811UL51_CERCA|nr:unnamed protein product [Ceratitis capitata]
MTQLNDKGVEHFKPTSRCLLTLVTLIFVFSATAFALTQISADTTELATRADKELDAKVVRILLNNGEWRQQKEKQPKKLLQQNDTVQLLTTAIKEEKSEQQHIQNKRDVPNNNNTNNNNNNNQIKNTKQGYYEEQQPVIVHAESLPTLGRRQNDYGDPQAGYEDPYYARSPTVDDDDDDDDDNEYEGEQFEQVPVHYPYQQQSSAGYYSDAPAVAEKNSGSEEEPQSVAEGRAAQNYDSYYRQPWLYATPAPVRRPNGGWEVGDNRKMHTGESAPIPFKIYMVIVSDYRRLRSEPFKITSC